MNEIDEAEISMRLLAAAYDRDYATIVDIYKRSSGYMQGVAWWTGVGTFIEHLSDMFNEQSR